MDAFVGEIRAFPYYFTPVGWLECDGSSQSINQYAALFATIGTNWGGQPTNTTFRLPDLRGVALAGMGEGPGLSNYQMGHLYGAETVTLTQGTMANHDHQLQSQTAGTSRLIQPSAQALPNSSLYSYGTNNLAYPGYVPATATPAPTLAPMDPRVLTSTGSGQPHNNVQPFLVLRYFINYDGYFMPRP